MCPSQMSQGLSAAARADHIVLPAQHADHGIEHPRVVVDNEHARSATRGLQAWGGGGRWSAGPVQGNRKPEGKQRLPLRTFPVETAFHISSKKRSSCTSLRSSSAAVFPSASSDT